MPPSEMLNALTIDVEDYFQVSACDSVVARDQWDRIPSRVERNTYRLLEILQTHHVQATFFVLGWVADRFPDLVAAIVAGGHEIGSHSYGHRRIGQLTPDQFREDLIRSLQSLEPIAGQPIRSFRAPTFSVTRDTWWALEILAEEGIQVDSSIFPIRHDRYGIPDADQEIHRIETAAGPLIEFPMSVARYAGVRLPFAGGGYFRIWPLWLTRKLMHRVNRTGRPVMFYLHPWEIDPDQPVIPGMSTANRHRHRLNLSRTGDRLQALLREFRFGTVESVLNQSAVNLSNPVPADPAPGLTPDPAIPGMP